MAKRPKRMATFRLSEATLAAIKAIADEREMSQAEVVEWLIEGYGDEVNEAARDEWDTFEVYLREHMGQADLAVAVGHINAITERTAQAVERVQRAAKRATLREQAA